MGLFVARSTGRIRSGTGFEFRIGGSESNVAIGLARLERSACWIGRVGHDPYGDEIVRALSDEGVTVMARRDPERQTGIMVKTRPTLRQQSVFYARSGSAGQALAPEDLDEQRICAARVLHVSGISLTISASAASAVEHAVKLAQAAGVLVSFDVNYRSRLCSRHEAAARIKDLIPYVDLLFASEDEADLLTEPAATAELTAKRVLTLGPREVVLTRGNSGAVAATSDGVDAAVAAVIVPVIDTVGAGDAFVAGHLAAYLRGESLQGRLDLAAATGAFACMSDGDWEGTPTLADLALFSVTDNVER